jgi:hypothetical protein
MFVVALPHAPSTSLSGEAKPEEDLVMLRAALPSSESDVLETMVRTALGESEVDAVDLGAAPHKCVVASTWKNSMGSFTVPGTRFQSCGERKRGRELVVLVGGLG